MSNTIQTVNESSIEETLEGYVASPEGVGEYPLDELAIRDERRTAIDVVRRINAKRFRMDPDFQRDFVWSLDKQSRLIESVLMRIPLPVFYMAEDSEGLLVVVDGLQRLTTLQRFIDEKLILKLPERPELDGKKFEDLEPRLQNRLEDCQLHFYIIDKTVPERARLDIFERVNGGEVLTRQQMRNAIYNGNATEFLKIEAQSPLFKRATGNSLNVKKMLDREFVNRFCSFGLLPLDEYKGDMDKWLANGLLFLKEMSEPERDILHNRFQQGLRNNFELFGRHAFRKHSSPQQSSRSVLNASLFDVMAVELSLRDSDDVSAKKRQLQDAFYMQLRNEDFDRAISYSPNSAKQVKARFEIVKKMFSEVFDAH
jgi:hypothetical protein